MKKKLGLIIISLIIIGVVLSTVGCNANTDEDVPTGSNGVVMSASILSDSLYIYQPNTKVTEDTPYDLLYSCRDNVNYYYGFDLGTVKNVIVDDNPYSIRYMGPANIKRTYTTSKVSSTSIENQSSWLEQRLEYDDKIANDSWEVEGGIKDVFSLKASRSTQYYSNTTTTTNSSGETVRQEVTVTESQSIEITFDSTCPYGEYRISHVMDYDVFVIATKLIKTGEITLNLMTLPRKGIIELYEYSDNGFSDIKLPELDFDSSIINDLPVPSDYIESGGEIPPQIDGDTINYAGGYGSKESPYLVKTATHFINISRNPSANFELIDDIAFSGEWGPISEFSGTLDGAGHTVSGLEITSWNTNVGLIGILTGKVRNLTFDKADLSITNTSSGDKSVNMGVICGVNQGTIDNVQVKNTSISLNIGSTSNVSDYRAKAGLITGLNQGKIYDSHVYASQVEAITYTKSNDDRTTVAESVVGGITGLTASGSIIAMCSSSNCTLIKATAIGNHETGIGGYTKWSAQVHAYAGGIAGIRESSSNVSGCTVNDNSAPNASVSGGSKSNQGAYQGSIYGQER